MPVDISKRGIEEYLQLQSSKRFASNRTYLFRFLVFLIIYSIVAFVVYITFLGINGSDESCDDSCTAPQGRFVNKLYCMRQQVLRNADSYPTSFNTMAADILKQQTWISLIVYGVPGLIYNLIKNVQELKSNENQLYVILTTLTILPMLTVSNTILFYYNTNLCPADGTIWRKTEKSKPELKNYEKEENTKLSVWATTNSSGTPDVISIPKDELPESSLPYEKQFFTISNSNYIVSKKDPNIGWLFLAGVIQWVIGAFVYSNLFSSVFKTFREWLQSLIIIGFAVTWIAKTIAESHILQTFLISMFTTAAGIFVSKKFF